MAKFILADHFFQVSKVLGHFIARSQIQSSSVACQLIVKRRMSNHGNSSRPKVYVTRRVPQKGVELLSAKCEISQWNHDDPVPQAELLKQVRGMDALFCLLTDNIDKEVIQAAGKTVTVKIKIRCTPSTLC